MTTDYTPSKALQMALANLLWDKFQLRLTELNIDAKSLLGILKVKLVFITENSFYPNRNYVEIPIDSEKIVRSGSELTYESIVCKHVEEAIKRYLGNKMSQKIPVGELATNAWFAKLKHDVKKLMIKKYYLELVDLEIEKDYSLGSTIIRIQYLEWDDKKHELHSFKFHLPLKASLVTFEDMVFAGVQEVLDKDYGENMPRIVANNYDQNKEINKKKPTIVRQNPINTDRIKPPHCPIHDVKMLFDPAAQKFYCTDGNCNQIARPKRDSDDKHVVLGVGKLQVRFIMTPGDLPKVVLISDDNVALNITEYVPESIVNKLSSEMIGNYILNRTKRVETIVTISSMRLAGLLFNEMLLMYEPD